MVVTEPEARPERAITLHHETQEQRWAISEMTASSATVVLILLITTLEQVAIVNFFS
jgi:hypothetical protein